jgi:succinate-semialdehyde dehydrogenase/glutarate-semialdehyde dehydrogenase
MQTLNDSQLLRQQAWIDGQWIDARSGDTITVTNPADGSTLGSVPSVSKTEVARAIDAADKSLPAWRGLTAKMRSAVLTRWYHLIMDHQEDLALILTSEQGKPLAEAKGEIAYAAAFRRGETVGHRPGGVAIRDGRISVDEIPMPGRHR